MIKASINKSTQICPGMLTAKKKASSKRHGTTTARSNLLCIRRRTSKKIAERIINLRLRWSLKEEGQIEQKLVAWWAGNLWEVNQPNQWKQRRHKDVNQKGNPTKSWQRMRIKVCVEEKLLAIKNLIEYGCMLGWLAIQRRLLSTQNQHKIFVCQNELKQWIEDEVC